MPSNSTTSHKTRSSDLDNPEGDRFWRNVRRADPSTCWEWTGSRMTRGYGQFWYLGAPAGAHRVAYTLSHGPIPEGQHILHRCDNRLCCNPDHLSAGSHADNMQDAASKKRLSVPRPNRHRLTTAQLQEVDALLAAGVKRVRIADRFGVSKSWVSLYARGLRRQYDRKPLGRTA